MPNVKISPSSLAQAVEKKIITEAQSQALWEHFSLSESSQTGFNFINLVYYGGGFLILSAMGWYMNNAWEKLGGYGLMATAFCYAILFFFAGRRLWQKEKLETPGGLLVTCAVWMIPLIVYGFERGAGLWPQQDPGFFHGYYAWVNGSWFAIEIATIAAGLIAIRYFRFPFLVFPVAFSLWFLSMDLTPLLMGRVTFSETEREWVSIVFGLGLLAISFLIDRRSKRDFAFWSYLSGLLAFWGGLSLMDSSSEISKLIYCLINVILILLSVYLRRRTFVVFGAIGVSGYLGHLAWTVFKDSNLFPFALCLLGSAIIYCGVRFQKNQRAIEAKMMASLPEALQKLRPQER